MTVRDPKTSVLQDMSYPFFHRLMDRLGKLGVGLSDDAPAKSSWNDGGLSQKLFDEYDRRMADIKSTSIEATATDLKQRNVFEKGTAIVFASCSQNTMNLQIWLETIFDLDVVMVYEPSQFYEWLFRFADLADLVFVERDSFVGDAPAFGTFMCAANEAYPDCPIVVLSDEFETSSFELVEEDQKFDITLKSPLSQTSIWQAMKAAGDIALNGKRHTSRPIMSKVSAA
ncbi:MAG: hypothetical protein R6V38_13385 [Roseovarius gahaiensis]